MGLDITVTCDGCGKDIFTTCNAEGYRIGVFADQIPHKEGILTHLHIVPPLDKTYYFCGKYCLRTWVGSKMI
ncbi:MAG: hypothetical protein ACRDFB_00925 [Rhabdochlamydiaceae bacterium]